MDSEFQHFAIICLRTVLSQTYIMCYLILCTSCNTEHVGHHDGNKCADKGHDCCASSIWHEDQLCKDVYMSITTDPELCPITYKDCP